MFHFHEESTLILRKCSVYSCMFKAIIGDLSSYFAMHFFLFCHLLLKVPPVYNNQGESECIWSTGNGSYQKNWTDQYWLRAWIVCRPEESWLAPGEQERRRRRSDRVSRTVSHALENTSRKNRRHKGGKPEEREKTAKYPRMFSTCVPFKFKSHCFEHNCIFVFKMFVYVSVWVVLFQPFPHF